jgi:hypothetical protein
VWLRSRAMVCKFIGHDWQSVTMAEFVFGRGMETRVSEVHILECARCHIILEGEGE